MSARGFPVRPRKRHMTGDDAMATKTETRPQTETENACIAPPIPTESRELTLTRVFDAPPEKLFRAWTEPELMKQWFCPRPWTTPHIETDVRAGGSSLVVMRGPEGQE